MNKQKIYKKAIKDYLENNNKDITIADISNFIKENYEKEFRKNEMSLNLKTIKRTVAKMLNDNDYLEYFNLTLKGKEKKGSVIKNIFEKKDIDKNLNKNDNFNNLSNENKNKDVLDELFSEEDEADFNDLFDNEDEELDDLFDDDDIINENNLEELNKDVLKTLTDFLKNKIEIKHIDHDTFYDLSFIIGELLQYDIKRELKDKIKEEIYLIILKKVVDKYIEKMKVSLSRFEENNN